MTLYLQHRDLKALADRIATTLFAAFKRGDPAKVGIDEIRAAIAQEKLQLDEWQADQLEEMTTRCFVEKCI